MSGKKDGGKKSEERADFVKWFSELNKDSGSVAGGKGANLAEIFNLKVPVPPGFVVTAQAYNYFIEKAGIAKKIYDLLDGLDYEDTKTLNDATVKIRDMIVKSEMPKEMESEIVEAYDILSTERNSLESGDVHMILKNAAEPIFVAVRSSATAEDLAEASFAGQQDSFLNVKGKSELIKHIKKCFASLFTARATYYRSKKGFEHAKVSLAVVVQKMIDSYKSGVIFSQDPTNRTQNIIMEAVWGLGEGIVSGRITPDSYTVSSDMEILDKTIANKKIAITRSSSGSEEVVKLKEGKAKQQVLKEHEVIRLAELSKRLEEHYKKPQDIEFAIENEEIFIVQTRPITTLQKQEGGKIREIKGEVILQGLAASPGIAVGKIRIVHNMEDLQKIKTGDILVTTMTNPDMVVAMQKSAGIVTDEGGMTAHAAIVSREMGIPAVVGTQEATTKLKDNEIITVDGYTGKVYKGKVAESQQKEVLPITAETKTKIKVIVDLPNFAERAAKSKAHAVGLTRMEGIIAESGKHPEYFLRKKQMKDYEEVIYKGIKGISKYFGEMWVRTSDIRTDEFQHLEGAPKEIEANPMLGLHGIRYSLKNPEIFKAELNALNRVSKEGRKMGLITPQVISVEELRETKKILKEIGADKIKVGIMIETPAAVQIIKELCEEGIDFISFGTNDLTQYILAVDRGNEKVQYLYDEMHPAVLYQLQYVIRVCKRYNVETSICGQSASKKEMVKYLVECGIDSLSVNADKAKEISDYVAEIEKSLVQGTDREPRNYKPSKKKQEQDELVALPSEVTNRADDEPETSEEIIQDIEASGVSEKVAKEEEKIDEQETEKFDGEESSSNEQPEFSSEEEVKKKLSEDDKEVLDIF